MKTPIWKITCCAALLLVSVPLSAATETKAAPAELANLERFLALSDAELDGLQRAIAHVRAMTAAERAEAREQIAQYRRLPAEERQAWRQGWGQMPADLRDGWRAMMQASSESERTAIRQRLEGLSPDERQVLRRQLVEEFRRTHPVQH